jgi:AcrR family transcriptional regulator
MARKSDLGARDRILATASRLFDERGVHAVGLQEIIDECGCGKNLLYREFGSKDELVAAYMEHCRQDWATIVDGAIRSTPDDPRGQLVAIVGRVAEVATTKGFRGCSLRNAHAEFPDADHPANRIAVEHYNHRRTELHKLAHDAGARDPLALADKILLILDGLNVNGAVLGTDGPANAAVAFAEDVVHAATRPPSS